MIVRCGRCRSELEVAGPGEFMCHACGTRNVVRGGGQAPPGYPSADPLPSLTIPGGMPPRSPGPPPAEVGGIVAWGTCPSCRFRFAMGEVDRVTCPNCRASLARSEGGDLVAQPG